MKLGTAIRLSAIGLLWLAGLTLAFAQGADAQEPISIEAFAESPILQSPRLSPDGKYIALYKEKAAGTVLMIYPLTDTQDHPTVEISASNDFRMKWFDWTSGNRLIYAEMNEGLRGLVPTIESRLYGINADGSEHSYLIKQPKFSNERVLIAFYATKIRHARLDFVDIQIQDRVINMLPNDPDHVLLAIDSDHDDQFEVRRLNVWTGNYQDLTEDYRGVQHWLTDQDGILRVASGAWRSQKVYLFRATQDSAFSDFTKTTAYQEGYRPIAFHQNSNLVYAWQVIDGGTRRVVLYDLGNMKPIKILFDHAEFSAEMLIYRPTAGSFINGVPVGVRYIDHRPQAIYFDHIWQTRLARINEHFPDTYNEVVSSTDDGTLHVIRITGATNPDVYYLYDEPADEFVVLQRTYTKLPTESLAETIPVSFKARDGLVIPSYLTLPPGGQTENLPVVILPHGGPHLRDYIRFDYWVQFLTSRGYAVFQPNFRGSSGYSRAYRDMGFNNWGLTMQDDLTDSARWLISEGIADPKRICIAGLSYGGYASLMASIKAPDLFQCAISVNGISNLPRFIVQDRRYIGGAIWTSKIVATGNSLSDFRRESPYHHVNQIGVPILLIHAKDDRRVSYKQSERMNRKLRRSDKDVELVILPNGGHELETQESRSMLLWQIEQFLAKHLNNVPGQPDHGK